MHLGFNCIKVKEPLVPYKAMPALLAQLRLVGLPTTLTYYLEMCPRLLAGSQDPRSWTTVPDPTGS